MHIEPAACALLKHMFLVCTLKYLPPSQRAPLRVGCFPSASCVAPPCGGGVTNSSRAVSTNVYIRTPSTPLVDGCWPLAVIWKRRHAARGYHSENRSLK